MNNSIEKRPARQTSPLQCPQCQATDAKAATLTERFAYLRCGACGEVWCIPERRAFPRLKPLNPPR
ncbi:MAG: hypothetical protein LC753_11225 [Acidobacteria bacterium]|nr:hypothetical protein [Acidobacteriota bacterium]MCA1650816.1 hypothetical protein [Acidobacteriota bacterium]